MLKYNKFNRLTKSYQRTKLKFILWVWKGKESPLINSKGRQVVDIEIYYCTEWNYQSVAAGLAEELREATGAEAKLVPERSGVFDVFVDGDLIYSMSESGRFPQQGEIAAMFKQ